MYLSIFIVFEVSLQNNIYIFVHFVGELDKNVKKKRKPFSKSNLKQYTHIA